METGKEERPKPKRDSTWSTENSMPRGSETGTQRDTGRDPGGHEEVVGQSQLCRPRPPGPSFIPQTPHKTSHEATQGGGWHVLS